MRSIEEKVKAIIATNLGMIGTIPDASDRLEEDLGADSLDTIGMLLEIEDDFNIEIPAKISQKLKTVGEVVKFVESVITPARDRDVALP
ncbi:acyl carrier protein [Paraburkholderia sp. BCC1886]|uniref:acyl carrier protein n=1 Tax=Paraburkholderia sp. BCC1886 TaxID=2562670 RepID=UPI001181CBE1|nr:acyl carrier protein [Paraburkholderia sp. BCC1886]